MLIKTQILKYGIKDKQGEIFQQGQIDWKEYIEFPIVTRDFDMSKKPIGRATRLEETKEGLFATIEIDFEIRPALLKTNDNKSELLELSLIKKSKDIY